MRSEPALTGLVGWHDRHGPPHSVATGLAAEDEVPVLLPMRIDPQADRPLLILDLDETLIFGTRDRLDRPHDALLEPYAIHHRPQVAGFMARVRTAYALAAWTSATRDYAGLVDPRFDMAGGMLVSR